MSRAHRPWMRRAVVPALLGFAAITAVLGLTQCRMIQDPGTELAAESFDPLGSRHKKCTKKCDKAYKVAMKSELKTHKLLIKGCGNDMQCRAEEHERYRLAKKSIEATKTLCKQACRYNEGGGRAGDDD